MNKQDLRIIFMGTPDFAVESLRVLVENGYLVVGVVTMPDKPSGRGHKVQFSPVKSYALERGLPLLQPEKLKDERFIDELKALRADLQIVVAFRMLPEIVWAMPRYGTFNLHASLLPQYRGAAPINWAIINGEQKTGVTTFFLTHEIDTGKIILQEEVAIQEIDSAGTVHDKLMEAGAELVRKTVDLVLSGMIDEVVYEQPVIAIEQMKAAPKIFKDTCRIDWSQPANKIHDFVRGLSPYPSAWTTLSTGSNDVVSPVKIFVSELVQTDNMNEVGKIITDGKHIIDVACGTGTLRIKELQLPGKKRMKTEEFLKGYKIEPNSSFV